MKLRRVSVQFLVLILFIGTLSHSVRAADQSNEQRIQSAYRLECQRRAEWYVRAVVGTYDRVGIKSRSWDSAVRLALRAYCNSLVYGDTDRRWTILTNCREAQSAGCSDPLIAYLPARDKDNLNSINRVPTDKAAMRAAVDAVLNSDYPAICKFFAANRAAARVKVRTGTGSEFAPESFAYREKAQRYLIDLIEDKSFPSIELHSICATWFNSLKGDDSALEAAFAKLEPLIKKHRTNEWLHHSIKGSFCDVHARSARDWGNSATRMEMAVKELESAWKLHPEIPQIAEAMMSIEAARGGGGSQTDMWFNRVMKIDPNNYGACFTRLMYLEPKWGGTPAKMLSFARECASSTNWGGNVYLILPLAHNTIAHYLSSEDRKEYWKDENIWKEIKAAYEAYYKGSKLPDTESRSEFLLYAYRTRQWYEFMEIYSNLKVVDYDVFGGKDYFDPILAYVKSKVAPAKK
jgi:hypothetical protein